MNWRTASVAASGPAPLKTLVSTQSLSPRSETVPPLVATEQVGSVAGPITGQHARVESSDGIVPQRLGEYRIIRELARGGMGIVYEAVQESLGRRVALKALPFQSLPDANHLERFRREAQAAAKLHHTNIVPVFGVGEHQGVHYFAMQFIEGQPLSSVLHELKARRRPGVPDAGESARFADLGPGGRVRPGADRHSGRGAEDRPVPGSG